MSYKFDDANHLHSLDDKPLIGVTTALGVISKPLTWWASGMACEVMGWKNPKKHSEEECKKAAGESLAAITTLDEDGYRKLLAKAYRAHSVKLKDSASDGVDLHALIEKYIKFQMKGGEFEFPCPPIENFIQWSEENVNRFLFSELHCYSNILWCGGIADFGYEDIKGNYVLGDIKSSREAYFSQWVQLGAYDLLIGENGGFDNKGNKIYKPLKSFDYHAIFAAGDSLDNPFFNYGIVRTKDAFCHALNLYKSQLHFDENHVHK